MLIASLIFVITLDEIFPPHEANLTTGKTTSLLPRRAIINLLSFLNISSNCGIKSLLGGTNTLGADISGSFPTWLFVEVPKSNLENIIDLPILIILSNEFENKLLQRDIQLLSLNEKQDLFNY